MRNSKFSQNSLESSTNHIELKDWLLILLISMITFCTYIPTLYSYFSSDDYTFLKPESFSKLISYFYSSWGHWCNFYRPLIRVAFALDRFFWKDNPFGYHLSNVLIHIANSIFVFFMLHRFCRCKTISYLSCIIFALAPEHVWPVSWISGRTDLICTFFILLGILGHQKFLQKNYSTSYFLLVAGIFFLVLGCKENGLVFPFLVIFHDYFYLGRSNFFFENQRYKRFSLYLVLFIILALYLIFRYLIFEGLGGYEDLSGSEHLRIDPNFVYINFYSFFYWLTRPFSEISFIHSLLSVISKDYFRLGFTVLLFIFLVLLQIHKVTGFGTLWTLTSILPVINITVWRWEGFVYLASVGFSLILGYLLLVMWRALKNSPSSLLRISRFFLIFVILGLHFLYSANNSFDWQEYSHIGKQILTEINNLKPPLKNDERLYFLDFPSFGAKPVPIFTPLPDNTIEAVRFFTGNQTLQGNWIIDYQDLSYQAFDKNTRVLQYLNGHIRDVTEYEPDVLQEKRNTPAGEIKKNSCLGQSFFSTKANLARIDVKFGTYMQKAHSAMQFKLFEKGDSEPIRIQEIPPNSLLDNAFYAFEFEPIPDSENKLYLFYICAPDITPLESVTAWATSFDSYSAGEQYWNLEPQNGDLCFRTFVVGINEKN